MDDFIFGPLSSPETRVNFIKQQYDGVRHASQIEPKAPTYVDQPLVTVTVGLDMAVMSVVCHLLEPEVRTIPLDMVATRWDIARWKYYQIWQAQLPAQPDGTLVRYTITATAQTAASGESVTADDGAIFSYIVGDPTPPIWSKSAIIYQIFPDRYFPGEGRPWNSPESLEGYFGGTIRGIIDKLAYLADLGFNCLWLNPFFPDHTYHGYHAVDYFTVNPRLGTTDDIRELISEAHQLGIRLILDFVANHWGSRHPSFKEARADRASDYYDWYYWERWPDRYKSFFGVKDLPKINLDHRPAREYVLNAAKHWLLEYDFDGFRLDYALGPSLDFWSDFRLIVQQTKPDAWIFGEVVEMPATQLTYWGRLHGTMDFLLQEALRDTFALDKMPLKEFDAFLSKHEAFFPKTFSRPSFLDNHDVNRFLWLAKGDKRKLKMASMCQFTLSGPPIVYYGTEVGLSQERDMVSADGRHQMAEARLPMIWGAGQDLDLHSFYRRLIQFRKKHPVLWQGERQTVHLDPQNKTYGYLRFDDKEKVIVAFNLGDEPQSIRIKGNTFDLPAWSGDFKPVN